MSNFVKSLAKINEDKICLFSELCLAKSLFPKPMLQFKENFLVCEVLGDTRSHNMLKHLTEDTGQGDWSIIGQ